MLKRFQLCLMAITCCAGSLLANSHPNPGQWQISADYLLLKPSVGDTFFVLDADESITDERLLSGTRKNNDFDYHSGFRVGGVYAFCECGREIRVSYTYLDARHHRELESDSHEGNRLWAGTGSNEFTNFFENYLGEAESRNNINYQDFDIVFAQQVYNCCGLDFYVRVGLETAYISNGERYEFESISSVVDGNTTTVTERFGDIKRHSKTWGIGPQIGFGFDYDLYTCCSSCMPGTLSINVLSTAGLLANQFRVRNHEDIDQVVTTTAGTAVTVVETDPVHRDIPNQHNWRVIPAFHTKIGLNYQSNCSCGEFGLEIGYEFNSFINSISRPSHFEGANGFNRYDDFHAHGLYVSANVRF